MSFNEDAWFRKCKALDGKMPDAKTCIPILKEFWGSGKSYFNDLNARLQKADQMGLFENPEWINGCMMDVNQVEEKYRKEGDKAFDLVLPAGPVAVVALDFYFRLLGDLRGLEEAGLLRSVGRTKDDKKDDKKDGKKDGKKEDKSDEKVDGQQDGSVLSGSGGYQGVYGGGYNGGYAGGLPGRYQGGFPGRWRRI